MIFKKFLQRRRLPAALISFVAAFSILISPVSGLAAPASEQAAYDLAQDIDDGSILHAWCWSFNTIRSNLPLIAASGYTSVQTSPISNCVVGNNGNMHFSGWYYHYQPVDYSIGNYQLGTQAEFAALCREAENYGIKIIVDVVANHFTSEYPLISPDIRNQPDYFHPYLPISNWNSRYEVTQKVLLELWDNNTQNTAVQYSVRDYLRKCIALGADGFRYDAAKHIELPDDDPAYNSSFWPIVLNNGAEYQYGEILQDAISRDTGYANYMDITASAYGLKIRNSIRDNNVSTGAINHYENQVDPSRLVTWVESHDNYANDIHEYGSSQWMNDEQIKLAWAVIGSRAGGTPLFFSRPAGGGGQTWDNRFPGITQMGARGSDLFFDDEVAAVNKFRNAMVGQNEYLRNPNGNSNVLMIERGNKGVVMVNTNSSSYGISSVTNLANGSYTNQTDNNNVFTVSNGRITGTLPARSVVVLYNSNAIPANHKMTVYYKSNRNLQNIHYQIGSGAWTASPGVQMLSAEVDGYKKAVINLGGDSALTACFNDGSVWDNNNGRDYRFNSPGTYTVSNGVITNGAPVQANEIVIYYFTGWSNPHIHYQIGNGAWTAAPGTRMSNSEIAGYKKISIPLGSADNIKACFNDGGSGWDNNNGKDYYFGRKGIFTVKDGEISSGMPQ